MSGETCFEKTVPKAPGFHGEIWGQTENWHCALRGNLKTKNRFRLLILEGYLSVLSGKCYRVVILLFLFGR